MRVTVQAWMTYVVNLGSFFMFRCWEINISMGRNIATVFFLLPTAISSFSA